MRSAVLAVPFLLAVPITSSAQAPDFSGAFTMTGVNGGRIVLSFRPAGTGGYDGTMANAGVNWHLQGDVYEDALIGTVDTGQGLLAFEAYLYDDELELILVQVSPDGVPDVDNGQEFTFTRSSAPTAQETIPQQQRGQASSGAPLGGPGNDSPLARQWRQVLAGKKVTYISSYNGGLGGGMSTRNVYHICSDGRFAFSDNSSISLNTPQSSDLGTPGGSDSGAGTWRVVTEGQVAGIELRYDAGEVVVYRLDMQNGQVFANGDRVYVTPGELCR